MRNKQSMSLQHSGKKHAPIGKHPATAVKKQGIKKQPFFKQEPKVDIEGLEELAEAFKAQSLGDVVTTRKLNSVKYRHFLWTEALKE